MLHKEHTTPSCGDILISTVMFTACSTSAHSRLGEALSKLLSTKGYRNAALCLLIGHLCSAESASSISVSNSVAAENFSSGMLWLSTTKQLEQRVQHFAPHTIVTSTPLFLLRIYLLQQTPLPQVEVETAYKNRLRDVRCLLQNRVYVHQLSMLHQRPH